MTNADPRFANMPVYLDNPQDETDLFKDVVDEIVSETQKAIADAFPTGQIPPMDQEPARIRTERYLQQTLREDLPLLQDSGYYEKYRRGELPAVKSPFWLNLLSQRKDFLDTQRDFKQVTSAYVKKLLGEREAEEPEPEGQVRPIEERY
jgi:hypothetical protein